MSKRPPGTAKASRSAGRPTKRSRRGLGKGFLGDLDRAWRRHGQQTLERLSVERPEVCFKVIVRLTEIQQRQLLEPSGFDQQRARADVLQRVQELARKT
jgi:hypothetical protein